MTRAPVVSAILIFRDAEQFIREALASVLAQTYSKWELLLVDDGSSDASTAIAHSYVEKDPERIRYLTHPLRENRGMSASRNLGIRQASGSFVALLDADDVWEPQKLEDQVAILEEHPDVDMAYGKTLYWHGWTRRPEDRARDFVPELGVQTEAIYDPPVLLPTFLERKAAVPCTCSVLMRRDSIVRLGAFEDSFRGLYEDQVLYAKIALHSRIYVSGECRDRYRQHSDSACSVAGTGRASAEARMRFLRWLERYIVEQRLDDPDVRRAIRRQLWLCRHYERRARPESCLNALRWAKKATLRLEQRLLPSFVRNRIWVSD